MAETDHHAFQEDFSGYYEGTLPPGRAEDVAAHLEACPGCRAEYDEFKQAIFALSGLHRMPAPERFEEGVTQTIRRRSGGRFFERAGFGDRMPFEAIAVFTLLLVIVLYLLSKWSATGALHDALTPGGGAADAAPGVKEAMPRL